MNLIPLSAWSIKARYIDIYRCKGSADFYLAEKPSSKNISFLKGRNCDGLICLYYFTNFKARELVLSNFWNMGQKWVNSQEKNNRARAGESTG